MQQIPEGSTESGELQGYKKVEKHREAIQHEIDVLFSKHEELRAKRSLTSQQFALILGFLGLINFYKDEEKATISLGIMYFPLLSSILLHRPVWKIRKLIYLYTHHGNSSRKGIQDPWHEKE